MPSPQAHANEWIKLHRKLVDSAVFDNERILKVWIWCMLKASYKQHEVMVGYQQVRLNPGEFIFGRIAGSGELNMSQSTVRNCMAKLVQLGNLDIKTTNKFSIIRVKNWLHYQSLGQQNNNRLTTNEQQKATNKKGKKGKNNPPISPQGGRGRIKLYHVNDLCVWVGDQLRIKGASGWMDWGGGGYEDFRYGDLRGIEAYRTARQANQ